MARSGLTVNVEGVDEVLKQFDGLQKDLNASQAAGIGGPPYYRPAKQSKIGPNSDMRKESKAIAELVARVIRVEGGDGTPQAAAVAATARAKSDRYVVVRIGSVAVRFGNGDVLSASGKKSRAGSVAHGSNYGPKGGHRPGGGDPRYARVGANFYTVARNDDGYWLEGTLERLTPAAAGRYRAALIRTARKWGLI